MWDKDDHFARSLHALSAIPVFLFILFEFYVIYSRSIFGIYYLLQGGLGIGAVYLEYRLLKYAITGRDCLNNKDQ